MLAVSGHETQEIPTAFSAPPRLCVAILCNDLMSENGELAATISRNVR